LAAAIDVIRMHPNYQALLGDPQIDAAPLRQQDRALPLEYRGPTPWSASGPDEDAGEAECGLVGDPINWPIRRRDTS
jgi:hypothetical protein